MKMTNRYREETHACALRFEVTCHKLAALHIRLSKKF